MNRKLKLIFILTIVLIIIDQTSKGIVKYKVQESIGNDFIKITLIENTGMAFGLNEGNTKNIILTVFILLIVFNFIKNQKERIDIKTAISLGLILAGGISNLIDRIICGGIIDFIEVKYFAVFNLADCYIMIGWIFLVIAIIIYNKKRLEEKDCEKK